jgi:hypothetical protein
MPATSAKPPRFFVFTGAAAAPTGLAETDEATGGTEMREGNGWGGAGSGASVRAGADDALAWDAIGASVGTATGAAATSDEAALRLIDAEEEPVRGGGSIAWSSAGCSIDRGVRGKRVGGGGSAGGGGGVVCEASGAATRESSADSFRRRTNFRG